MNEEKNIIIDYLSVTFPLVISENEDEQERSQGTYRVMRNFFHLKDCECEVEKYATNNYKYQYKLAEFITLRCAGPVNDSGYRTCQLELKGEGCREFERRREDITWLDFFNFLYGLDPTFKRIDISVDDFSGQEISQNEIKTLLEKGLYTSKFKSKPYFYGSTFGGLTIEMGGRKSPIQLCIYDKKREQQNKGISVDSEYWVRYEMRFRGAKADAVVLALCRDYRSSNDDTYKLDLQRFASEELYNILQLKENNNFSNNNSYKANDYSKWIDFLGTATKAELPKAKEKESTTDTRRAYIMPKAAPLLMLWCDLCGMDFELFQHDLLKEIYYLSGNFTKSQKKRYNQFRVEHNLNELNEKEFEEIRMKYYEKYNDMELPF